VRRTSTNPPTLTVSIADRSLDRFPALVQHGEDVIIAGSVSDEEQRRLPGRLEGSEALHPHRSSSAYRVTERASRIDLGSFIPDRIWERIKRDFQVAVSVVLRRRQLPASDVHLEGGKDELRDWQGPVALLP